MPTRFASTEPDPPPASAVTWFKSEPSVEEAMPDEPLLIIDAIPPRNELRSIGGEDVDEVVEVVEGVVVEDDVETVVAPEVDGIESVVGGVHVEVRGAEKVGGADRSRTGVDQSGKVKLAVPPWLLAASQLGVASWVGPTADAVEESQFGVVSNVHWGEDSMPSPEGCCARNSDESGIATPAPSERLSG